MYQTLRTACFVIGGFLLMASASAWSEDKYKLEEPVDDVRIFGVGTRITYTGKVRFPKDVLLAQTMTAVLSYRERRLLGPGGEAESFRSVREYETAEAEIVVDGNKSAPHLPSGLKLIVAQGRPEGVELYGLNGLLTADELNLIRSPADSLALIALLPSKEVEVGEKWTVPNWAFQMLTALDAVIKGELVCTLDSVDKGIARIKMSGALDGAVDGATTEVKVTGFFTYNLEKKYIAESDFVQSENRAIGPIGPGLNISARIRILRQPGTSPGKLADTKIIEAAVNESPASAKFLRFESPWNISIQHARNWHVYKAEETIAIFRLLEEGNLIAQCDMASITPAKPGGHLAEQIYLSDIRQSLGDRLKSMTNGEVIPSSDHKFIYKVTAEGAVDQLQVMWVFYLVADPSGRQASLMFTVDPSLAEKLAKYDRDFVESLKFGPAPATRAANK